MDVVAFGNAYGDFRRLDVEFLRHVGRLLGLLFHPFLVQSDCASGTRVITNNAVLVCC